MKLHILGSNSLGNCYILETDTEALILEAGVRLKSVKMCLNWQIRKVVVAVISHEHNDHSGYVAELVASGVYVLALKEVFKAHGLEGKPFTKAIEPFKGYKAGNFGIQPVLVRHDVPCVGYVITHPEMGKLLFITDTITLDYRIPGMNHIMIEANYADDIVERNIENGSMPVKVPDFTRGEWNKLKELKFYFAE